MPMVRPFYVPGVAPRDFREGDGLDIKAVKLTSSRTQLPYEYYSLPFCKPKSVVYKGENLGKWTAAGMCGVWDGMSNVSLHLT
uniref:Transmembrane 9 superfamily member n=1 Tax=Monopterus albus TaxID=43700 RepID=A0A3Q3IGJ9_MONAL